jgi:RNA-dependent RNA polymerase
MFLAYSSSALREHSVWFMRSFSWEDPDENGRAVHVTPDYIRTSIGDFEGTKLIKWPSKYAARLALAFTATDPSVRIWKHQWIEDEDLTDPMGNHFTDGCGTISSQLGDEIWEALGKKTIKPFAYQIRFLGYKGKISLKGILVLF